jgi:hypothetical protein
MKTILALIFLIFGLGNSLNQKMECMLNRIYERIELSPNAREAVRRHLKEQDFGLDVDVHKSSNLKLLGKSDFQTQLQLEALLMNYGQLPSFIKQAVSDCGLSIERVLAICKETFPESGCEVFDGLIVARKCPKYFMNVNYSFCVPQCPPNLLESSHDPMICQKTYIAASQPLISEHELHYSKVEASDECPEDYTLVSYGICARECPLGWVDIGKACEKPTIQLRNNEVFYYKFELDEKKN